VRNHDSALPARQKTQQITDLQAIQERLCLGGYVRLAKRADELVEPEREPKTADASCAPERDTVEPARKGVIARRRLAQTLRECVLQSVLREIGVQKHRDESAVDARIRPPEHRFPDRRAVVVIAGHPLLYGSRRHPVLSARRHLLPERYKQHAIVVCGRQPSAIAIRGQHEKFAARYLEYVP
jgi:hypothetical protein